MNTPGKAAFLLIGSILAGSGALGRAASADEPGAAGITRPSPAMRGNPLWATGLDDLSATRERPLFSPSRRPPPVAVEAPPPPPPPAPPPSEPPRPALALIGTVLNASDGYGIFMDQASNTVLRLRTGEDHQGWILRSVSVRDALLQKDRNTAVLTLPARDLEPAGSSGASPAGAPAAGASPAGASPAGASAAGASVQAAGTAPGGAAAKPGRAPAPEPIFYPEH